MNRFKSIGICVLTLSLALSGCAANSYGKKTLPQAAKQPVVINEAEMDGVISVFSETIKNNPEYAGAYYNRAIAYFYYQNNYEKCWQDVHKAESLGLKFSPDFVQALKKASNREK